MQRGQRRGELAAEDAALRLVQEHMAELLRFARRFTHCADDAHDAYQRTLETLVRRLRTDPPASLLPWVRTVLRHEALALRKERERLVDPADLDGHAAHRPVDPVERAVGHERLRQAAEALGRLKPQEATALVLRAQGLSYAEIASRMGWTYTKTNRCVTEGRMALRERLGAIESGAECERWAPLLSALADGEATAGDLAQLRPHLRACAACRATLRDFHAAPGQVAALVPPALVPLTSEQSSSALGHLASALHGLTDRAATLAARVQSALELAPGTKLAAVAASTAALAGGGAVVQQAVRADHPRSPAAHVARTTAGLPAPASLTLHAASLPVVRVARASTRRASSRSARSEFTPPRSRFEFVDGAARQAEFAGASGARNGAGAAAPATSSAFAASSVRAAPNAPSAKPERSATPDAAPEFFPGP